MAKQLQFYSFLLLLLAGFVSTAIADEEQEALEAIIEGARQALDEKEDIAGDVARELGAREPDTALVDGWQHPTMPDGSSLETDGQTAQQRAWNEIANASEGMPREYVGVAPPRPKVPDNVMYVFISLSMPEATIKELFLQAIERREDAPTIFVLRGWTPPNLQALVSRLNDLFPEANKLRALPNVQINPTMFQRAEVDVVPTYVAKDSEGVWRRLIGEISLKEAARRIRGKVSLSAQAGPVFEIEEPDVLEIMQERMASHDWEADVERAKENIYKRTTTVGIDHAEKPSSYLVDLTIRTNQNLAGANNEVFARKGELINPLDYMQVSRRYLFFDANQDDHLAVVDRWLNVHPRAMLITTAAVNEETRRVLLTQRYGTPIHEANALLIKRFKLSEVPAMAYQEGRMLRVDVEPASKKGETDGG